MILALDVGNSQIYGGVFNSEDTKDLRFRFRKNSSPGISSDELGLFLKSVLKENELDPEKVHYITMCSVVPQLVYSLKNACKKYFNREPFTLQPGVKTGLKIKYRNPIEVGSDRIANAIAAVDLYPGKNLIIIDFGTATTYCAISANKDYLGGLIVPGLRISMEALESKTAKLPSVEIVKPEELVGRSTIESIQSGLYYGTLMQAHGIIDKIKKDYFKNEETIVIGTGGFARLFQNQGLFQEFSPDLVLHGLQLALKMNL